MSASMDTATSNQFDIHSVCKRCMGDDHWSKNCRNERIFFCWICGRKNTKTTDCCSGSKDTKNQATSSNRTAYPEEPIYFDNKKGLCATVGFGYDLVLAKIDTRSFRSFIGELYANELGNSTNIKKANIFVNMQDGSEKYFGEELRTLMKLGNWQGYMTFLVSDDIKGHIVLGLDFLTLTNTKLTTCGVSLTLSESEVFVNKDSSATPKTNVRTVSTSTSTPASPRTTDHKEIARDSHTRNFSNMHWGVPNAHYDGSLNRQCAPPDNSDNSLASSGEQGSYKPTNHTRTTVGSPSMPKVRPDPNFKRYILSPDKYSAEMCELILQRQKIHQQDPRTRMKFMYVFDGISYRINLSRRTSNAIVRVLGPVQYIQNVEEVTADSTAFNVAPSPFISVQQKSLHHEPNPPETQHKRELDPTFVRYTVPPAEWSEGLRNIVDHSKASNVQSLRRHERRFTRDVDGVSYRIVFNRLIDDPEVTCLGPILNIPLSSTTASTASTQSTESTGSVDMDLGTDDETVPDVSKNKALSNFDERSKIVKETKKKSSDDLLNLETEDISSDDKDFTAVTINCNELSSVSSDTDIDDFVSKDDQKEASSTKEPNKRKKIEIEPEYIASTAKILRTVGSCDVSSNKKKKTSEITTVTEEKNHLNKSHCAKENTLTESTKQVISAKDSFKPSTTDPVKQVESILHITSKVSAETHVQESDSTVLALTNLDVNAAVVKQTTDENDNNNVEKLVDTKIGIKRASEEKILQPPPSKMICMETTQKQLNNNSLNTTDSDPPILATATVLEEPKSGDDSDCVIVIDKFQSKKASRENTGKNRKSSLKKLPLDNQLEIICISDDDDIENIDISVQPNTLDPVVNVQNSLTSKTESNLKNCEERIKLKSNEETTNTIRSTIAESAKKNETPTKTAADIEQKNPTAKNGQNQESSESEAHSKRLITTEEQPIELKELIKEIRKNWTGYDKEKSFMRVFNGEAYFVQLYKGKGEEVYARKWSPATSPKLPQHKNNDAKPSTSLAAKLAEEQQATNSTSLNRTVSGKPKIFEEQLNKPEQLIDLPTEKDCATFKTPIEANKSSSEITSNEECIQESKVNEVANYWPFPENVIDQITLPLSEMTEEICNQAVTLSKISKSEKSFRRVIDGVPYAFSYNNASDLVKVQRLMYSDGNKDKPIIAKTVPDNTYVTLKELTSQLTSKKKISLDEAPVALLATIKNRNRSNKYVLHRQIVDETVYLVFIYNTNMLKLYHLIFDGEVQKTTSDKLLNAVNPNGNITNDSNDIQAEMPNFNETNLNTEPWPFEDSPIHEIPVALNELPQELSQAIQELQQHPIGREISFRKAIDGVGYTARINKSCNNVKVQRYIFHKTAKSSKPKSSKANVDKQTKEGTSQKTLPTKIPRIEDDDEIVKSKTVGTSDVPCTVDVDKSKEITKVHAATIESEKKPTESTKQNIANNKTDMANVTSETNGNQVDEIIAKMKQITIVTLENNGEIYRITLQDSMFWAKWQHLVCKVLVPAGEEPEELKKVIEYYKKRTKPKSISIRHVINDDEFYAVIVDRKNHVRQCRITFSGTVLDVSNEICKKLTNTDDGTETEPLVPQQNDQTTTIVTVEYNGEVFHITLEDEDFWSKWKHLVSKEALSPNEEPQELKCAIDEYKKCTEHKDCSFRLAINGNFYTVTVDKNGCVRSGRLIFTCVILKIATKGSREITNDNELNLSEATTKTSLEVNKTTTVTESTLSENSSNKANTSPIPLQPSSSTNQQNQQVIPNTTTGIESEFIEEMNSFFSSAEIREFFDAHPDNEVNAADAVTSTVTTDKSSNLSMKATNELESRQTPSNNNDGKQKLETTLKNETENKEKPNDSISSKESLNQVPNTSTKQQNITLDKESQISAASPVPTVPASSTFPNKPLLKIRTPAEIAKLKTLPFVNGNDSLKDGNLISNKANNNTTLNDDLLDESFPRQKPVNEGAVDAAMESNNNNKDFNKIKLNLKSKSK